MKGIKVGTFLLFIYDYHYLDQEGTPRVIDRNTFCEILDITYDYKETSYDEMFPKMVLSYIQDEQVTYIVFNYAIHKGLVKVVPDTQAAKLLYEKT